MKNRLSCDIIFPLFAIAWFIATVIMVPAVLAEHLQHGAHEHGVAHLNVAIEGDNLYIDVLLFRVFPGIEHIEVQLLTGTRQTAMELTASKSQINI